MSLDEFFRIGTAMTVGSHTFEPEAIKAFARKYHPELFHTDGEAAKNSPFGELCASGWHTAATWMKYNFAAGMIPENWDGPGPKPEIGPALGFRDLKWLKPVYAGETVRFTRTCLAQRPMASRPGWRLLSVRAEAFDSTGDKVMEFDSSVLVKVE